MTKINKQLNLFLFISNLSEWHFSCRKSFNEIWKTKPTPLSDVEKTTLLNFVKILKKYNKKNKEHLIAEFVKSNSINWQKISNRISSRDVATIKNAFQIFQPRFEYFYSAQKRNMVEIAKFLENNLEKNKNAVDKARVIYQNSENFSFDVLICLSENSNKSAGGMYFSSGKKGYIVIQFGDFNLADDNYPLLNTFYHEISHHFQNTENYIKLVNKCKDQIVISKKYVDDGVDKNDIINEIVNAALWGEFGVLSQKVFSISDSELEKKFEALPKKDRDYYDQIKYCAYKFRGIIQKKISDNLALNNEDILSVVNIWNSSIFI
ncbi:MAG: hypothetical protein NTW79_02020 [Candidatus Berkelbacteria bacterium]|nr:hypothetical protein [Candidatus Berkelbacteria bacterium]